MKAMLLEKTGPVEDRPLCLVEMDCPEPQDDEVLLEILTCGVCHTELDEIEGRLKPPNLPIILG